VSLKIINISTNDIFSLSVLYKDGEHNYSLLKNGENLSVKIKPAGATSITILYEENYTKYIKDIQVYLEPGYNGDIEVLIYTNGNISRKGSLRLHDFLIYHRDPIVMPEIFI
jgi:hypothetical protein